MGPKNLVPGVIVIVSIKDRHRFILTGLGLQGILPDGKVGEIGRQMVPMLRNNDFDGAMTLAVDEISQIIAQDAGVQLQPLTRWGAAQQRPHATPGQVIGGIVFLILVVIFLVWAGGWWGRRLRRRWRRWWRQRKRLWGLRRRFVRRWRRRWELVATPQSPVSYSFL